MKPDCGSMLFNGHDITGYPPHKVALLGIGRTFQVVKIFKGMTVFDNILVPALRFYKKREEAISRVEWLCDFFEIRRIRDELASEISGGQQKLLELARAIVHDPQLLLLDEPFYGIHPELKAKIINYIKRLNEEFGRTFLIVSHDMPSIRTICNSVLVMHAGEVIYEGTLEEARKSRGVLEAYLGV
ncbi:MAG: ATP-binding cassette domain-containing protein [Aigarchaeota archaeon]|nr:ATP-binding cassette domain-containing protein [Candidatus Pelearchaeum maunauluense]